MIGIAVIITESRAFVYGITTGCSVEGGPVCDEVIITDDYNQVRRELLEKIADNDVFHYVLDDDELKEELSCGVGLCYHGEACQIEAYLPTLAELHQKTRDNRFIYTNNMDHFSFILGGRFTEILKYEMEDVAGFEWEEDEDTWSPCY